MDDIHNEADFSKKPLGGQCNLMGKVVDGSGNGMYQISVQLTDSAGSLVNTATTDNRGNYEFKGVATPTTANGVNNYTVTPTGSRFTPSSIAKAITQSDEDTTVSVSDFVEGF